MTTVVYRDGILAADGLVVGDNVIKTLNDRKIFDLFCGKSIAGFCGTSCCVAKFVDWSNETDFNFDLRRKSKKSFEVEEGFFAIEIMRDLDVALWDCGLHPVSQPQDFYAIGIGYQLAWGAMKAGASAEQAVRIAAESDIYTGGEIMVVDVREHFEKQAKTAA